MKVLFLAAEASPLSKVGGLGDVGGELPRALRRLGLEVITAVPLHAITDSSRLLVEHSLQVAIPRTGASVKASVHLARQEGLPIWVVDSDAIRAAPSIYTHPAEDGEKFVLFSRTALIASEALGWIPDIIHANDWHTAPAVVWARHLRSTSAAWAGTRSILTIHNLAFMGAGSEAALEAYGLPTLDLSGIPEWARQMPLPLGLAAADGVTTVSPTYANEIRTPELGCGLDGLLRTVGDRVQGVLNGIDQQVWDPAIDDALPLKFDSRTLSGRKVNKRVLQRELGLPEKAQVPLVAMVTRLDYQKGVDLALEALPSVLDLPWQFVLLGTGDEELEASSRAFAAAHPDRVRVVHRFDPVLSRRLFAGSDVTLVPSRFEPCGLTQMIAMRYGSIPLVRATGGLRDTVAAYAGDQGTGFAFDAPQGEALATSLRQALSVYQDAETWRRIQQRAMAQDFSWARSAGAYRDFYERTAGLR